MNKVFGVLITVILLGSVTSASAEKIIISASEDPKTITVACNNNTGEKMKFSIDHITPKNTVGVNYTQPIDCSKSVTIIHDGSGTVEFELRATRGSVYSGVCSENVSITTAPNVTLQVSKDGDKYECGTTY